jgi:hypothetical protein
MWHMQHCRHIGRAASLLLCADQVWGLLDIGLSWLPCCVLQVFQKSCSRCCRRMALPPLLTCSAQIRMHTRKVLALAAERGTNQEMLSAGKSRQT